MAWTKAVWPDTDERRQRAEVNGTGWVGAGVVRAHHGAQARAAARDRRIRDEDLALAGRARFHQGNVFPAGEGTRQGNVFPAREGTPR